MKSATIRSYTSRCEFQKQAGLGAESDMRKSSTQWILIELNEMVSIKEKGENCRRICTQWEQRQGHSWEQQVILCNQNIMNMKEPGLQWCWNGRPEVEHRCPTSFHSPSLGWGKANVEKTRIEMMTRESLRNKDLFEVEEGLAWT